MSVVVVTPSAALVAVHEAKAWAPVLRGDDDARTFALLACAQATLDPPSWLGSTLGEQVLEFRTCAWSSASLPYGPATEILNVKYDDAAGVEQALGPDVYRLAGAGTVRAHMSLRRGKTWPAVDDEADAIRVRYRAGFPLDDPRLAPAKQAIVLSAIQLRSLSTDDLALRTVDVMGVESRTYTVSDAADRLVQSTVRNLLTQYRVWSA